MKCLVCGKEFEGDECPRCHFPVVNFPGDREAGIRAMAPTIQAFREGFLEQVSVGLVVCHWKESGESLTLDYEERLSFGTCGTLRGKEFWLEQKFARDPKAARLSLRLWIGMGEEQVEKTVEIPNLMAAELQRVGIDMDENADFCLMLKNDTEGPVKSEKVRVLQ